ncbi:MAG: acetylxylan esterase, partial [Chloroflexota bacterium]
DVFDVRYTSFGGLRIAGWYARPAGATGHLPGLLTVPGYVSEPKVPKAYARQGYAVFSAAPRGKLRSNAEFNPGYPGLLTHNITDRDSYAYRGFYVDAIRAFDVLAARAEVDNERLGVTGSSQGGALTLLVSALRSGMVKVAAAGAPYLCSFLDAASLTRSYPYEEINDYLRLRPEDEDLVRATVNYYDIQNFAPAVRCPIIVNIGLKDDVCPPETGYAVFDAIGSEDKRLYEYEDCGHDAGTGVGHQRVVDEFLASHLNPSETRDPDPPAAASKARSARAADDDRLTAYWSDVARRAASVGTEDAVAQHLPLRSTESSSTYGVTLKGVGGQEIFSYYSVPVGDGPFPTVLQAPGYGSVVPVPPYERRQSYAVMALCHRGQRLSDGAYAAEYPGLLTDGLHDPEEYVYGDIMCDLLAALAWLRGRDETDTARLAVAGSELGFLAAALRPTDVSAVLLSLPLHFRGTVSRLGALHDYPAEEFNDYLRAYPERAEQVAETLSLYDPLRHASSVSADVLIACPDGDEAVARPLAEALGARAEMYVNTGRGHTDHEYQEEWLRAKLLG